MSYQVSDCRFRKVVVALLAVFCCSDYTLNSVFAQKVAPVTVVFQNNSDVSLNVVLLDEKGQETKVEKQIPVNHKLTIADTFPGHRWKFKDSANVDLATYTVDYAATVALKDLLAFAKPQQVTFLNTLSDPCDILWFDPVGNEVRFASLKPGQKTTTPATTSTQATRPKDRWSIRVRGELVADYYVTTDAEQVIDLKALVAQYENRVMLIVLNPTGSTCDVRLQLSTPQADGTKELVYRSGLLPNAGYAQLAQANTSWKFVDTKTGVVLGYYRTSTDRSQIVDLSKLNQ